MDSTITAADANREFSALLRRVRSGQSVVVTSHGRPVARIVPMRDSNRVGDTARAELLNRLRRARAKKVPRWTRDELYES